MKTNTTNPTLENTPIDPATLNSNATWRVGEDAGPLIHSSLETDPLPLTDRETDLLRTCEATIEQHKHALTQIADALRTIKEQRLYRATHATFQLYCEEHWHFTGRHAYRLIRAAEVIDDVGPMGNIHPIVNERHARSLVEVPKTQRRKVVERALEIGGANELKPEAIREAVVEVCGEAVHAADQPVTPPHLISFPADPSLPSVTEMAEWATSAYNLFSNPTRKDHVLGLIGKLKNALNAYAEAQHQQAA